MEREKTVAVRILRRSLFVAAILISGYLGFRRFIAGLLPAASSESTSTGTNLVPHEVAFRSTDGIPLNAWWLPVEGSRRVAVLVHGRGDSKSSAYAVATVGIYAQAGFNVLMIDLRKHDWSEGTFSTAGYQEVRDVLGALSWLRERGFDTREVVLHGWSTGAAAVVEEGGHADLPFLLGSLIPGKRGPAVLMSHAASLTARLLGADFDPFELRPRLEAEQLYREGVPLLIIHSISDRVVPVEHARLLAAAHPAAWFWELEKQPHTAAYTHPEYSKRLLNFLHEVIEEEIDTSVHDQH